MPTKAKAPKKAGKLDQFFEVLGNKSSSTIAGYRSAIRQYMTFIYNNDDCEQNVEHYFKEGRNYHATFVKFIRETMKDKPGLSALQTFNQIKNFHALCDVNFSAKEIKQLKNQLPSGGVATQESDLDTDTIRAILQHCDVKGRAIILCLASGGMRIGEMLQVRCADVDLTTVPACIQIRADQTKTKMQRYTFISSEAVAAVREWIKVRPAYLQAASKQGKNFKTKKAAVTVADDRLFPVSDQSVNELFREAVTAVFGTNETDKRTLRSTHHVHQLRKFFISQLSLATSESVADFFSGHKSALSDSYRRYTARQMADYYLKGEHLLFIEAPAELREAASTTKKEIAALQGDTLKNHSVLLSLMQQNTELKDGAKKQQATIDEQHAMMLLMKDEIVKSHEEIKQMRRDLVDFLPPMEMVSPDQL